MVATLTDTRIRYQTLFAQFQDTQDEAILLQFNELGVAMNRAGIAPEVAVENHALAIDNLESMGTDRRQPESTRLLPLMEVIMAYGITFRHQLDKQRHASETQFFRVLEQSRDMVFITDEAASITYANPAYRQAMTGPDAATADGCPHFVDYTECRSPMELWEALRSGETFKGMLAVLDAERRIRIWSVRAFSIAQDQDLPNQFVFLAEDIGAQLAMTKRLRRSERLTTLGELASGISHEFNNILLIISGFAELIKDDADSKATSDFSTEILKAVEKGRNLNEQILSFSKDNETDGKPVRLDALIGRIRELVKSAVGTTISLTFNCPADLIVTLKEDHLCQILTNLCINAKHAIQSKGPEDLGHIRCHFRAANGQLLVTVKDNGIGMEPGLADTIFEPFFTTKRTGEGSGLGLAIVLKIVDHYHGQIDVASELGIGTEFRLCLPVIYGQPTQSLLL